MRIERHADTGQLVLWCLGEAHADVVLERLRATGAQVETVPLRIGLHETFTADAHGHGRLVKQSGGHGQYAVCDVSVTPLPRGSGVEFAEKVVGGAVPSQFISSVEKGVRDPARAGPGPRPHPGRRRAASPCSTASRTASTPPTPPSRPRARWR